MKLIAESGGTKTQWCGVGDSGDTGIITTIGLNPNFVTEETFKGILRTEVFTVINDHEVTEVYFYGAGCSGTAMENKVRNAIRSVIQHPEIFVFSDLTGAARSLLGTKSGFVCMLGTGSNSGYYDGRTIILNVPPLGFILGDEGSGASLGKKILADFLRGIMPPDLAEEFRASYGEDKDDVVSHVYRGYFPSKFIGGFVRFLRDHLSRDYCHDLVRSSFEEFVNRNLKLYKTGGKTEIAATGSVAWYFRDILDDVLRENGFILSKILKEPVQGLIRYHREHD